LACTAITLCWPSAALIIWSQVKPAAVGSTPAAFAADLRNQSSWVLAQNGAATSWSFQYTVSSGPLRTPFVKGGSSSLPNGGGNPGTRGGPRLITPIELSLAASRRTSCSRCEDASVGSVWIVTW